MKQKLRTKIEDILTYKVKEDYLICKNSIQELFLNNRLIAEHISDFYVQDYCLLFNQANCCSIYNLQTNSSYELINRNAVISNEANYFIFTDLDTSTNLYIKEIEGSGSKKERVLIHNYDWNYRMFFIKEYVNFYYKTSIKSLSAITGEYEWEIDLGDRSFENCGEIEAITILQIIGVSGNNLLVFLSDHSLISIDSTTGKTLWEFSREAIYEVWKGGKNFTTDFFRSVNIENHQLFVMKGNSYFVFDIATQTVQWLWQAKEHYEDINIVATVFTEDYIYFTACYGELPFNPNLLGVFNRKTLEIEWLHDGSDLLTVSGYQGSFRQIQVAENKLYALDNSGLTCGTLHIFEKEENA